MSRDGPLAHAASRAASHADAPLPLNGLTGAFRTLVSVNSLQRMP